MQILIFLHKSFLVEAAHWAEKAGLWWFENDWACMGLILFYCTFRAFCEVISYVWRHGQTEQYSCSRDTKVVVLWWETVSARTFISAMKVMTMPKHCIALQPVPLKLVLVMVYLKAYVCFHREMGILEWSPAPFPAGRKMCGNEQSTKKASVTLKSYHNFSRNQNASGTLRQ